MRMDTYKVPGSDTRVLGPCPGCLSWQVEYTDEVVGQFATTEVLAVSAFAGDTEDYVSLDISPFYEVIEDVLAEHLDECVHLRRLIGDVGF